MDVSLSDVPSVTEAVTTSTTGGSDLDEQAFLNLLITQLQYQDPMNPQDSQEFVAQLAQFSSLEELMSLNDGMDTLYMATSSMNNAAMTQLIGKEIVAYGDSFSYSGEGEVSLWYEAEGEATDVTINIYDEESGELVYSESLGSVEEGEGEYVWDGSLTEGGTAEEGTYYFEFDATDADGAEVGINPMVHGVVDTMNYESGSPVPEIGGVPVELGDILRVEDASGEDGEAADGADEEVSEGSA